MINAAGRKALVTCILLLALDNRHASCSLLNYRGNLNELGRNVRDVKGARVRLKRFSLDNSDQMTQDSYMKDYVYDEDEIDREEEASDEVFSLADNMKPIETTTVSDVTNRTTITTSPLPLFSKNLTADVEDCCRLLRIGSFDEFERCLGDRCLAPNTCDGPKILEECFFDGSYYPVHSTVHMDESKCYIVKCTQNSTEKPPATEVEDFGTGCCVRAGKMYLNGTQIESETCLEGNWTAEPTTTPATSTTPESTPPTTSTTSEEPTTPVKDETSPLPSTTMVSETSSQTEPSFFTTAAVNLTAEPTTTMSSTPKSTTSYVTAQPSTTSKEPTTPFEAETSSLPSTTMVSETSSQTATPFFTTATAPTIPPLDKQTSPYSTDTGQPITEATSAITSTETEATAPTTQEPTPGKAVSTPSSKSTAEPTSPATPSTKETSTSEVFSTSEIAPTSPEVTVRDTTITSELTHEPFKTTELDMTGILGQRLEDEDAKTSTEISSTERATATEEATAPSSPDTSAATQPTSEASTSKASTSTERVPVSPEVTAGKETTESTTRSTAAETSAAPDTTSPPTASTTELPTTTPPPDNYTCRWDNMTVSTGKTILRDPRRCLNVECWRTVFGTFIDVTIVHEARGCCELEGKQMVPPGYITTTRYGGKKRCVFGRWLTQYFDAAINLTSSKDLPFKSKTYQFFPRMTPITEALEICEKINGTLAIPDNREQEMELGELGAEAFGGQATFYINQEKIQQHIMNGRDEENPEKYIVYPHDTRKMMHIKVNKPGTAYAVESFVENIQRLSVPICEQGGKNESFPEYFNNLVSIGTLTGQGLPKEAAYQGMRYGKDSKAMAKLHEWRLPPVPRRYHDGHTNIGVELTRWGQVHRDLAEAIKNKQTFKDPLPVYKANHFNER